LATRINDSEIGLRVTKRPPQKGQQREGFSESGETLYKGFSVEMKKCDLWQPSLPRKHVIEGRMKRASLRKKQQRGTTLFAKKKSGRKPSTVLVRGKSGSALSLSDW